MDKDKQKAVRFVYVNHKGETRMRTVIPEMIWFGTEAPWHTEPQWLLSAFDEEKGDIRTFAASKIYSPWWKDDQESNT